MFQSLVRAIEQVDLESDAPVASASSCSVTVEAGADVEDSFASPIQRVQTSDDHSTTITVDPVSPALLPPRAVTAIIDHQQIRPSIHRRLPNVEHGQRDERLPFLTERLAAAEAALILSRNEVFELKCALEAQQATIPSATTIAVDQHASVAADFSARLAELHFELAIEKARSSKLESQLCSTTASLDVFREQQRTAAGLAAAKKEVVVQVVEHVNVAPEKQQREDARLSIATAALERARDREATLQSEIESLQTQLKLSSKTTPFSSSHFSSPRLPAAVINRLQSSEWGRRVAAVASGGLGVVARNMPSAHVVFYVLILHLVILHLLVSSCSTTSGGDVHEHLRQRINAKKI